MEAAELDNNVLKKKTRMAAELIKEEVGWRTRVTHGSEL